MSESEPPIDTYTPILWVTMTEDQKYGEYIRVRAALSAKDQQFESEHLHFLNAEVRIQELTAESAAKDQQIAHLQTDLREGTETYTRVFGELLEARQQLAALRHLVERWQNVESYAPATPERRGFVNAACMCADELASALAASRAPQPNSSEKQEI